MSALEVMFSRKAAMKRRYGKSLVACVHAGLEDDFEVDRNPRKSSSSDDNKSDGPPQRLFGGLLDRAGQAIKTWRNKLVAERADMTSSTVLSNHQIKAVAAARPANLDELRARPDIRNWQVQDHGEAILAILDDVAPELSQAEDGSPVFQERSRRRRRRR